MECVHGEGKTNGYRTKVHLLLYLGDKGVYLFVSHVPELDINLPVVPKKEVDAE